MKKLIPMTDFVLEQNNIQEEGIIQAYNKIVAYAEFLKQPLILGMFIPCDENGNVLHSPEKYRNDYSEPLESNGFYLTRLENYNKAKERVLFEGFELRESKIIGSIGDIHLCVIGKNGVWADVINNKLSWRYPSLFVEVVEDLINEFSPIELTPSALKQIGIES